jgi:histone H3/H4
MGAAEAETWKRCSSCKAGIAFGGTYYACSVSTCNKKRGGFVFCSVDCWDEHVPMMRHRDAWAVEETAPTQARVQAAEGGTEATAKRGTASSSGSTAPVRRRITVSSAAPEPATPAAAREVLVIASRLKSYVRARFGMNTSDAVLEVLSDEIRRLADRAARVAREDGRKTVLERDFDDLRKSRS